MTSSRSYAVLTSSVSGVPVVSVDLSDSSMAPGGRGYQRLHTGLRSRLQMKADFLLSHHPGERPEMFRTSWRRSPFLKPFVTCVGGGASLQPLLSRYDWSEHRPDVSSRTLTDLSCPTLLTAHLQPRDIHSVLEWLGAVDAAVSW